LGKNHKKRDNSLEKWKEWQDHQYDPGYWTGGNIPPYLNEKSKTQVFGWLHTIGTKAFGWVYILASVALIAIILMILLSTIFGKTTVSESGYPIIDMVMVIILFSLFGGFGVLGIFVGIKYLDKSKSKSKSTTVNVLIISLVLIIGLIIVMRPSDTHEMLVKNKSGETVIFRFEKEYFGSGTSCCVIDPASRNEIAHFPLPGQINESKRDGWSLEYLVDSPKIKVYGVKGGFIFKVDGGKYQVASNSFIFNANPKDSPDLVLLAKALVATQEWGWLKTFGSFLLEAGDQDVRDILKRYAEGQFTEEELKKNQNSIIRRTVLNREDIQSIAKEILGQ
jgi:hypothetical protein